jgi:8-oxo-dGTP pyrophosphatase MutT (NUDIX family)
MPSSPDLIRQAAAIPVKAGQVCLVTSRSGKRWVIPKGCMEPGKTAGEIALQEAWEEAGLVGVLAPEPLGTYFYEKAGFTCLVTVFLMHVTGVVEIYPEHDQRERSWVTFSQALRRIEDLGLRELIRAVEANGSARLLTLIESEG